jgi:hypothetical protein
MMLERDDRAVNEETQDECEVGEENAGGVLFSQRVFMMKGKEFYLEKR